MSSINSVPIALTFLLMLLQAEAIEYKCTACRAVAAELQRRLDNERPRNHLDLRHRLDSEGNRYGKVIEYKASELRAVEIMDGLCATMKEYTLVTFNDTETGQKYKQWTKVKGAGAKALPEGAAKPEASESEVREKQLGAFCGALLEEHDEDITSALMSGEMDIGTVDATLCTKIAQACKAPKPSRPTPATTEAAGAEAAAGVKEEL